MWHVDDVCVHFPCVWLCMCVRVSVNLIRRHASVCLVTYCEHAHLKADDEDDDNDVDAPVMQNKNKKSRIPVRHRKETKKEQQRQQRILFIGMLTYEKKKELLIFRCSASVDLLVMQIAAVGWLAD